MDCTCEWTNCVLKSEQYKHSQFSVWIYSDWWKKHNSPKENVISHPWRWKKLEISCTLFWCDFDRASSLMCGNKMSTRCNRGFYCRSYCLLNMFRAPLCSSSGAQEYYTVVAACGISCCGFQVVGLVWSWGLCVWFAGCCSILQTGHITLNWWA